MGFRNEEGTSTLMDGKASMWLGGVIIACIGGYAVLAVRREGTTR